MSTSLRTRQHRLIQNLANCIEAVWQEYLDLSPFEVPADLGYIEGSLEGSRLVIENHCYQTPQFRKLHLELAQVSNGLDILHCVMFPRSTYPLPMFGTDLVGGGKAGISAAIADVSPISPDRQLPVAYQTGLTQRPALVFVQPRQLPTWGDIFSEFCLFIQPTTPTEEDLFLEQVRFMLTLHCQIACAQAPLTDEAQIAQVLAGQRNYCQQQQQNDKTRRVLEKSFGAEWAERYMTTMLFDYVE